MAHAPLAPFFGVLLEKYSLEPYLYLDVRNIFAFFAAVLRPVPSSGLRQVCEPLQRTFFEKYPAAASFPANESAFKSRQSWSY
jgi:hypothetical protein